MKIPENLLSRVIENIFQECFPRAKVKAGEVANLLPEYNINTPNRLAHWGGQVGHESGGFSRTTENLNYSSAALLRVFPRYFNEETVKEYHRQPEKIANKVYGNRMGNKNPGDGWRFRGRGLIQLTGKQNYKKFAKWAKNPAILENPALVSILPYSLFSSLFFWTENSLNEIADGGVRDEDVRRMTRRINGGYNGLSHRRELTQKIHKVILANIIDEDD